ncbi:MAG: IPT/TIG domain-containing protein [Candidatus Kapaibacteriota bacterium]
MQLIPFYNQPSPILSASPLLLDFGIVTVGQTALQSASVSGANLVSGITTGITRATVSAYSYSINMGAPATQGNVVVSGGAMLNVSLRAFFTPLTTGTFSTTITVTTASAGALTLTLTGTAILPRIPTPPIITALSTTAALIGTPVTVTGLNFTNVSQASIGGIATTINILSATQANVILPTGLSIGQVVLTNVDGTAVSRDVVRALVPFLPPPIISAAAPLVGVAGDLVSVTGANFSTGATTLLVGGVQFAVTFNSSTRLTFALQPSMQGAIGVRTPNGSTTSSFIVRVIPPPTILGITPTQASNGETFTLLGTNFINVISVTGANMRLDSTSWQIDTLAQRLTVRVLENFAVMGTIGTLTLRTRSGTARYTQAYTPAGEPVGVPVPALTTIQPFSALQEGDEITLSAINIPTGATLTLTINGITTTISSVTTSSSGATLRLRLPIGIVPLALQSSPTLVFRLSYGAQSTSATFTTTVRAANLPQLTAFSPNIGGTCSTISIVGRNLGLEPRGRLLNVLVGGAPVRGFRVLSPTVIEATLGTVRTGAITLLTSGGQVSTTAIFTFDPAFQCFPPMRREDSLALDAFYVATVGLNWTTSTNWTNRDVPAALRFGVKVVGDRVTEVRMPKNNVNGSIPDFVMQNLTSLRVLDLDSNSVAGALPRTLGQATNLEILRLAANRFVGALPPNLAALKSLRELNLADNVLADTLEQIWDLVSLETLNLRGNRFRGRVSARTARLALLTSLDLSRNQLSDTLPAELGLLTALQTLNLRGNRFTGALPDLGKEDTGKDNAGKKAVTNAARALRSLDVGQNALSGTIPASLGVLRELRELRLDGNTLQGVIPSALANLGNLKTLDVSRNQFTDAPSFLPIFRLDTLRLADNRFDFATLESQVNIRPTAGAPQSLPSTPKFGYAPQSVTLRLSERTDTTVTLDAPLQLRINARGANNRYAWWRDGVLIQATSGTASLLIPSVTASDSGSYFCVVSNTLLPDVVFTSAALRVTTAFPAFPPQDSIRLIAPALAADNVSTIPTFIWTSVPGARQYRLEVSGSADFRTLLASAIVSQSAPILTSGRVEFSAQGTLGFPLATSARIFWRVRAENARGLGAAASSEFTTASGDALIAADRLDFGRVPRGDTAFRLLTLRNLSVSALRVESLTPENGVFASPLPSALTLAVGRDTTLIVRFVPSVLSEVQSGITARFRAVDPSGQTGALQTQTLLDRLRGSGGALKVIAPRFDTIPVRATRIASALLINVSGRPLEITNIGLLRRTTGFELRFSGTQRSGMDIGDTLVIPIGCRSEVANVVLRDTLRVQTNLERIDAPLEAFSRNRTPNDVAVKLAIRPQQNNLPPGSAVTLELFVVPTGSITLDSVFRAALPFIQATISADKNVLALSPNERFARVRRLDTSRIARFVVPSTTWSGRNSVVAQLQCVVVAGNTDSTALSIEDVQWGAGSVILDEVQDGTFKANVSRAGGKRLISPTTTPTQLTAIAPNPAKEEIEIAYTMGEAGLVTISLMDARGNVVLPIVNAVESVGKHTVRAKIGWLASGSYHIRLTTTLESDTRQIQIVR